MALVVLSLTGCSDKAESTVDVDGIERNYTERLPNAKDYALIIALHGGGDSVVSFENYSHLTDEKDKSEKFGVVYLEGEDKHWNDGRSEINATADDVGFINSIIEKYKKEGANKFYVVGMSNGGVMAQRAACDLGDKIDGIAVVAATQSTYLKGHCKANSALKTMFIFGTEDSAFLDNYEIVNPLAPSQKRGTHIGITETIAYWIARNNCLSSLTKQATVDDLDDDTSIDIYESGICDAKIKYYSVDNGGHRWPDPTGVKWLPYIGYSSQEISSAEEIVKFFGLQ